PPPLLAAFPYTTLFRSFAALARLHETGGTSQNQLGQLIAMDAATIKGVIDRLKARGLVSLAEDMQDRRRLVVSLTQQGRSTIERDRKSTRLNSSHVKSS